MERKESKKIVAVDLFGNVEHYDSVIDAVIHLNLDSRQGYDGITYALCNGFAPIWYACRHWYWEDNYSEVVMAKKRHLHQSCSFSDDVIDKGFGQYKGFKY